jgi:hypothetical protein
LSGDFAPLAIFTIKHLRARKRSIGVHHAEHGERNGLMAAFEWLELQTLTGDIAAAQSRLAAARSSRDDRRVRVLEQEIATAEQRRSRLLAFLTTHLAGDADETANEDAPAAADEPVPATASRPSVVVELRDYTADAAAGEWIVEPRRPAPNADGGEARNRKGDSVVWEQLTPSDLDHARSELDARRDKMLARHAEELKSLDADREQLTSLETAIGEFLRRFGPESAVIKLGEERELRATG